VDELNTKILYLVSEDQAFCTHRLDLAKAAKKSGYEVVVVTKVTQYEDEIISNGFKLINLNLSRSASRPLRDFFTLLKLIQIYKKEKPDIVHHVTLKVVLLGTIATLFSGKIVSINAFTGLGFVFSSSQIKAKIIRLLIRPVLKALLRRKNAWMIFQNPDDLELFNNLGLIEPDRSVIIRGSGVDINEFEQTPDVNNIPVIMLASRMLWDKGVGEFVDAAKRAHEENLKAKFIIVGDIDKDNPMSISVSTLKKWTDEGYITWDGHSNNMSEKLSSASVVCLPSYREGLPKVLLEGAAIGRPLIATDVPGCREIIINNVNGILVKLKDVDSLYNAIKVLVLNSEMRFRMGQESRVLIETKLSANIINTQTLDLYKTAINK
jgi:glycosyltransferase involved in cell wall biosynthesis